MASTSGNSRKPLSGTPSLGELISDSKRDDSDYDHDSSWNHDFSYSDKDEGHFGAILVNYRQIEEIPSVLTAGILHMRHKKTGSWSQDSLTMSEEPPAVIWHP
ncbi:hypothetical protein E2C01_058718 [Portunus trituberculatus]|uniref:Uncharacterized protein n=1 Tax=Portunus trituberculatus TaxID=210409 RepID=A0A5B7GWB1_PORTR|nr:hypothetical protein [Portunus trituberculatus]